MGLVIDWIVNTRSLVLYMNVNCLKICDRCSLGSVLMTFRLCYCCYLKLHHNVTFCHDFYFARRKTVILRWAGPQVNYFFILRHARLATFKIKFANDTKKEHVKRTHLEKSSFKQETNQCGLTSIEVKFVPHRNCLKNTNINKQ